MSGPAGRRETFATRFGLVATMIGVAVGLGNVWRFPYMVGRFGGAAFVAVYAVATALLAVPVLMAEWALGRHTRRGPVGAFAAAGLPAGRPLGWIFFFGVTAAAGYYLNALGWVLYYAAGELAQVAGLPWAAGAILPPGSGFDGRSLVLQAVATGALALACAGVLQSGLRAGIERVSKVIVPALFLALLVLIARALTLPGATAGVEWYLLKIDPAAFSPRVLMAALGQAFFSLSLGGTFMVVYGSYLGRREALGRNAVWTAGGDLAAGLAAGLAILPAVIALGLEPDTGPGLLFVTLPEVFARVPAGGLFGLLFFVGLLAAAFLSAVAGFEVLVAALTDHTRLSRRRAVWLLAGLVYLFALPPMVNLRIFVPWDLTFGSGFQIVGSLLAVVTVGWCLDRSDVLAELGGPHPSRRVRWLYVWLRYAVPAALLLAGGWWLATEVLGLDYS